MPEMPDPKRATVQDDPKRDRIPKEMGIIPTEDPKTENERVMTKFTKFTKLQSTQRQSYTFRTTEYCTECMRSDSATRHSHDSFKLCLRFRRMGSAFDHSIGSDGPVFDRTRDECLAREGFSV
eukprot:9498374-Pyramimonas_sp.AAC.3